MATGFTGQCFRIAIPALWAIVAQAQPVHDGVKFHNRETRILIIGKTGNGKSSLGNVILGQKRFTAGRSMSSTTREVQVAQAEWGDSVVKAFDRVLHEGLRHVMRKFSIKGGPVQVVASLYNSSKSTVLLHNNQLGAYFRTTVEVVDTPDPVNSDLTQEQLKTEIEKWKRFTSPGPSAILLAVRCDVRYTAEEYDIYKKIKAAWADDSFKHVLVIAFTFGDRQDRDLDEELKTVCPELKHVLKDSGGRYALFNSLGSIEEIKEQVQKLQNIIDDIDRTPVSTGSSKEAKNGPGKISPQEAPGSPEFLKSQTFKNVMAVSCAFFVILAALLFKKRF